MKLQFLPLLAAVALISSCSSQNKATSSPENGGYYMPGNSSLSANDQYGTYYSSDDQYLRMKVQNNSLWSTIDDYDYWNNSQYDFGFSCAPSRAEFLGSFYPSFYSPFSPFNYYYNYYTPWGGWYAPVYTIVYYKSPQVYNTVVKTSTSKAAAPSTYANPKINNYSAYSYNKFQPASAKAVSFRPPSSSAVRSLNSTSGSMKSGSFSSGFRSVGGSSGGFHFSRGH